MKIAVTYENGQIFQHFGHTAVELDARLGQCCLRTAADASADQSVHAVLHQKACQCTVTAAVGINNFRMNNLAVRSFIKLELFGCREPTWKNQAKLAKEIPL